MDRNRAPLYEALIHYGLREAVSFHVPGHKNGKALNPLGTDRLAAVMGIDVTEIAGMDDLHHPDGVIAEAQRLAAACFGAEETCFLIGGSTAGNLAFITALCDRDDILLVQRNVHKSVIHGLMLAGAQAVFLPPETDETSGLAAGVSLESLDKALRMYPEAKGVLLTNPNYYGMGMDLKAVAERVHAYGKPLIVDEAHGAHYGLHPELPPSALQCGADGVVQSTHKMLAGMTMSAMLHMQGPLLNREIVKERLAMLQSSSPSYPLMASLDLSRHTLHTRGADSFSDGLNAVKAFRRMVQELPAFDMLPERSYKGDNSRQAFATMDPFKIVIRDRTGTLSGYDLLEQLGNYRCFAEMADMRNVVVVFSLGSTLGDAEALFEALKQIADQYGLGNQFEAAAPPQPAGTLPRWEVIPEPVPFRLSFGRSTDPLGTDESSIQAVSVDQAIGRIAAEMVIPYPPGIPVLYKGERVTAETARYLAALAKEAEKGTVKCQGVHDPTLTTLRIYNEAKKQ